MCSEDDECLAKNEQLLETYCSERYFLPPLNLEGVSVSIWNWDNTIDEKIIFPLKIIFHI